MTYEKKALEELVNLEDPAWPLVQQWISDAGRLGGSETFHFSPPLSTRGPGISDGSRRAMSVSECFEVYVGAV
jgi:hypothetical protein